MLVLWFGLFWFILGRFLGSAEKKKKEIKEKISQTQAEIKKLQDEIRQKCGDAEKLKAQIEKTNEELDKRNTVSCSSYYLYFVALQSVRYIFLYFAFRGFVLFCFVYSIMKKKKYKKHKCYCYSIPICLF